MARGDPRVSVVVPTIGRPHLVTRAIRSALAQTLQPVEVIVVVDGPDEATVRAVEPLAGDAVRIVALPERVGLGGARNTAIARAGSPWIALLDDDDEWLPDKLEAQLGTAQRSAHAHPIVACRFIDRRTHGDVVLPERLPAPHEAPSEYLFCRPRLLVSEGVVLPSTMLMPRRLAERVSFRYAEFAHEGSDWLLRALRCDGAGLEFVRASGPLAIRHAETTHTRMSTTTEWRTSLGWARDNTDLLTPRARAAFLLTRASLEARRQAEVRAAFWLVWEAFRHGRPTPTSLLSHVLLWLVPERARFEVLARLGRRAKRGRPA
jgi:glycosyltransferase involved in cell wall biosynthesis